MPRVLEAAAVAALLAFTATFATGCEPATTTARESLDTVQEKRVDRNSFGIALRKLCVGQSRSTCEWKSLGTGKVSLLIYRRCEIGDPYPACRKA